VDSNLLLRVLPGRIGIGHTRWATHGKVTEKNAPPHTSCNGEIAVVHNGIIQNYSELKSKLMRKGHIFRSETDMKLHICWKRIMLINDLRAVLNTKLTGVFIY
jgi:glucosamine--fructose-6-phosphate aminotransferase (isomerizing)